MDSLSQVSAPVAELAKVQAEDALPAPVSLACLCIGLWIYYVWSFRASQQTQFRAGNATNLKEEFAAYGYSENIFYLVGATKCSLATVLIAAVILDSSVAAFYGAFGMGFLMVVAIYSHVQLLSDPLSRNVPAVTILALCGYITTSTCPDYIPEKALVGFTSVVLVGAVIYGYSTGVKNEPEGEGDAEEGYQKM